MIGIIDSGCGGFNVICECLKYYNEDFVYLIDNKNCPYGNKKEKDLKKILKQNIDYLIKKYDLDLIIIGCNTLSCFVDYEFMQKYKIPILKTVPNLNEKDCDKILVFATKNTLKNCKLIEYCYKTNKNVKFVYIKDLPKLIDQNISNDYSFNEQINKKLLKVFCRNSELKFANVGAISLGCTHFKFIKPNLKNILKNFKILECETLVAYNSKFLVRKNKSDFSIKLEFTLKDEKLEKAVKNLIKNIKKEQK